MLYVYGHGPRPAEVMLIGERPGGDEAKQGRPFVGKSGKELDRYLLEGGIHRSDVYVTNLCKSYSPSNDDPTPEEIKQDEPLLIEELKTVRPRYIGLVGRFAARYFLGNDLEMEWAAGIPFQQRSRVVMPIWHPAFGLHSPNKTPLVWWSFQQFCRMVKGELDLTPIEDKFPKPQYIHIKWEGQFPIINPSKQIHIDTEGTAENPWGLSFTQYPGRAWVILSSQKELIAKLVAIIKKNDLLVVGRNIGMHDLSVLRTMGIEGFRFRDNMVRAYHTCLEPQGLKPHARRVAGMRMQDYDEVIGEANKAKAIDWLVEAWTWANNRWPEESKVPSPRKPRGKGTRRSRKTSPPNVLNSNGQSVQCRLQTSTT
jgi:uracil-DNA glycosylase family 4